MHSWKSIYKILVLHLLHIPTTEVLIFNYLLNNWLYILYYSKWTKYIHNNDLTPFQSLKIIKYIKCNEYRRI